MKQIVTGEGFQNLLQQENEFILLKHSLTCPISASAKTEVEGFEQSTDLGVYLIPIQEARDVSQLVAEQLEISHESPQAFHIKGAEVKWHASHFDITRANLSQAVSEQ
ncbi:bacillithiol system redox-active protein YtxJ [Salimicrobium flavidum]|uniref:Bacillithiol system protein YtxJ n=1 Tax=Salimicrobium flavidum TaxID=570947 RepID=A0A1N7JSQ1_9BACI|nr:bacillithiol system redox-active protein YtxJ [Salimicrobium flavidum]SIS52291.1 bacillithiol system protein YtxJ [Salimicrobium flavidum]